MWKTLRTPYLGLTTFPISLTHPRKVWWHSSAGDFGPSTSSDMPSATSTLLQGQAARSSPLAGDELQAGSDTLRVVRHRATHTQLLTGRRWSRPDEPGWTKPIPFYQLAVFKAELHSAGIMETHSPGSSSCYRKTHKQELAGTLLCLEDYRWRLQNKHGYCLISDKQRFLT